ncbi:hypothetical protein QWJ26_19180 [Streptomyces sp. CSDS2]|nr:hypothetical protein [Streptomyces sp. CSDS2]MDN3261897.1 hypothetical protein [Streptomyces sp. CSDS2]
MPAERFPDAAAQRRPGGGADARTGGDDADPGTAPLWRQQRRDGDDREHRDRGRADTRHDPPGHEHGQIRGDRAEQAPGGVGEEREGEETAQAHAVRNAAVQGDADREHQQEAGDDPGEFRLGGPELGPDRGKHQVDHVAGGDRGQDRRGQHGQ